MSVRSVLIVGLALGLGATTVQAQATPAAQVSGAAAGAPADTAFKTAHLFNLGPEDLGRLTAIMAQYNAVFLRLKHPEARYRLWQLETPAGDRPAYLWESTWPSRSVYDAVHGDPAFQAVLRATFAPLSQMLKDHSYGQYRELPLEQPQP